MNDSTDDPSSEPIIIIDVTWILCDIGSVVEDGGNHDGIPVEDADVAR